MTATLTFLGGAGTVTGSKYLVQHDGGKVLVDCGLFQGLRELRRRNWDELPVDPRSLDAVVLSHAHLDHCGYLPRLVAGGFRGVVHCTEDTAALVEVVLRDSAHLQEEEATNARRGGYSRHDPPLPLYDDHDVERTLRLLRPVPYDVHTRIAEDLHVILRNAGHILGSASPTVHVDQRVVVFSGDLGRPTHPLLDPPAPPDAADTIVVESTYGNRRQVADDPDALGEVIRRTVRRGGSVLIPAFAVDRTELVLLELARLTRAGEIPRVPVFLDSPMALAALDIYRTALAAGRLALPTRPDPFDPGELRFARTAQESAELNDPAVPCVIVSASGMATGGRVVHHLRTQLPDPRNTVVLVGYQAVGTRGRDLLDGARHLKMHGRYVPVRCDVVQLADYSVHADAEELMRWLANAPKQPDTCFVVHGELNASSVLAERIADDLGWCAVVPRHGEKVRLD